MNATLRIFDLSLGDRLTDLRFGTGTLVRDNGEFDVREQPAPG